MGQKSFWNDWIKPNLHPNEKSIKMRRTMEYVLAINGILMIAKFAFLGFNAGI